jgi:hypothetical protein
MDTTQANRLIASDRVEGTAVYNRADERLGTIERFMVDKASGQVEFAVLAFGGLFGLGEKQYPLPWQALAYDTDKQGYVVNVTREQIEGAPSHTREEAPVFDRIYGEQLYAYYGVTYI